MEEIIRVSEELRLANKLIDEKEKYADFIKRFEQLGDLYKQQGELLNNNREKLKAVAIYNLALASEQMLREINPLSENSDSSDGALTETQKIIIEKIKVIEEKLILSANGKPIEQTLLKYCESIKQTKSILQSIRDNAKASLQQLDQTDSSSSSSISVQFICQQIAEDLRNKLINGLLTECFQALPVPKDCIYSIIVLGSIARAEATPFSDFEFAVLIQDQSKAKNEEHKAYFRCLTELLWIKVLNLSETTARMMDIQELNWLSESESPTRKGFAFDGQMEDGCHTPLGNMHHTDSKSQYELIGTPEELAGFQEDKWQYKRGLSTVLSTVEVLDSNDQGLEKSLVQTYQEKIDEIFNRKSEGTEQTLIQRRSLKFLSESVERFQFRGGRFDKEMHYFDAKYHLYRLPNMLVDHLSSYFNIKAKSLWKRIEGIWGSQGGVANNISEINLKAVVSTILKLRLEAYLKKGYRDDHILMIDSNEPEKKQEFIQKYFSVAKDSLIKIYSILIPLQWEIQGLFKQRNIDILMILKNLSEYDITYFEGYFYSLILSYDKAILYFKKSIAKFKNDNEKQIFVAKMQMDLGRMYDHVESYEEAINAYEEANNIFQKDPEANYLGIACLKNALGNISFVQQNFLEARKAYESASKAISYNYYENCIELAEILHNLANTYCSQGLFSEAEYMFQRVEIIYVQKYGEYHDFFAGLLLSKSYLYHQRRFYNEAVKNYEKARKIYLNIYGEYHVYTAAVLNLLGRTYADMKDYDKACSYHEEAKRIFIEKFSENRIEVADILHDLGVVYQKQRLYQKAMDTYKEAKNIYKKSSKNANKVVIVLLSEAELECERGEYELAVSKCTKALCMVMNNHMFLKFQVLNFFGDIYREWGQSGKAIEKFEMAKKFLSENYGENHDGIVKVLAKLGVIYFSIREYDKSKKSFEEALNILVSNHGEGCHDHADILVHLGNINIIEEVYDLAFNKYEEADHIYKKILDEDSVIFADIFHSKGLVFWKEKKYEESIECFESAKKIRERYFESNDKPIIKTLYALLLVYWDMNKKEKIFELIEILEKMVIWNDRDAEEVKKNIQEMKEEFFSQIKFVDFFKKYSLPTKRIKSECLDKLNDFLKNILNVTEVLFKKYEIQRHFKSVGVVGSTDISLLLRIQDILNEGNIPNHVYKGQERYYLMIKNIGDSCNENKIIKFVEEKSKRLMSRQKSFFTTSSQISIQSGEAKEKVVKPRESLKNQQALSVLLAEKIPVGLILGCAYGQGDCFFDALAQSLNQINHTDVNTIKYLRMECHDFYGKNKDLVDQWNSQEYGGIDNRKDEYGMVQYTVEECNKHFYSRGPIWGRSQIEGIILCRQLDLEGICIIEILEDPETERPVVSFHLANKERYKSIEGALAQELLKEAKIPVLVVEQNSLHFVPLLLNQTREILVKVHTEDDIIKESISSALNQHGMFASSSQAGSLVNDKQPEQNNEDTSMQLDGNNDLLQEELKDSDEENKDLELGM